MRPLSFTSIPYALIFGFLSFFLWNHMAFAESTVTLQANRDDLSIQQTLRATVEVSLEGDMGGGANLDEPDWAQQGWSVVSRFQQSSMQIFNTQRSLTVSYIYQLKPIRTGKLNLGPFIGKGGASGSKSEMLTIQVYEGSPKVTPAQKKRNDRYALMRWETERKEIWLGERVDVALALYVNTELRITQYLKPDLDLSGAWLEDVEVTGRSKRARLGNDLYYRKEAEHKLISPLKAGTFTLPKLSTGLTLASLGFGRVEENITVLTPEQTIEVKPLPPNPPKGFKGPSVGHVKLEALVDRTRLRVDEGVQLTIKTTTDGLLHNTPTIELPYIEGLKSFPPTLREDQQKKASHINYVRSQTWLLKPTQNGQITIPKIELPFFNPTTGTYEIANTPAIQLKVTGDIQLIDPALKTTPSSSKSTLDSAQKQRIQEVDDLGVSFKSIRTETLPLAPQVDLRWPLRILALLTLGLWLSELLRTRLSGLRALGTASNQRDKAYARFIAHLQELQNQMLSQTELDHARIDEILRNYLQARFGKELRGLTRVQVAEHLHKVGLQQSHIEGYEALCERLDFLRFAQGGDQETQNELLVQLAREWVTQVNQATHDSKRKGSKNSAIIALLIASSISPSLAQASPKTKTATTPVSATATPIQQAHEAFWSGDLKEALKGYQSLLKADPQDPTLWYNLGTTQAHLGRFGQASYSLQMALHHAPHDTEARVQLERVIQAVNEDGVRRPGPRRLVLPDEITSSGGLLAFFSTQSAESLWWLTLSLLGLCLWLLQKAKREPTSTLTLKLRPFARVSALLLVVICLLAGLGWWLRHQLIDQQRLGIVTQARAPLRRGPAERFPAEVNIAGAVKVQLQGTEGDWQRVVLFDGREGWLNQAHVLEIK